MADKGPTAQLCEWASSMRYEDIPDDVRVEALKVIYDETGAMIAGSTLESCKPIVDLVRTLGGTGECTVAGHPFRAPLLNAILANASIGHADEVDATSVNNSGHFAATMVPTALTVGEYKQVSGKQFVRAFVLGAEVAARMQSTTYSNKDARPEFYYSAGASLGAAVTTSLMLGLDADKMEHALGTAAMGCAPLVSLHDEELHQTKALAYSGRTARSGVESALLAQNDFHAPREILTCENGFFHAFVGNREAGHNVITDLGKKYFMKDIMFKRYSTGGPNLAPLYAFLQVMKQNKITGDDVASIEVSGVRPTSAGLTDHHQSIYTETVISLAACYGDYTFRHAHELSYVTDPRFVAFRKRVPFTVVLREGPGADNRAHRLQAGITVRTVDGKTYQQQASYPLMTQEELEHKFKALAGLRLDAAKTAALDRKLKDVAGMDNVAKLVSDLQIAY